MSLLPRQMLSEFIGTFTLVFIGCGAVVATAAPSSVGLVGVALAFGIAVAVVVSATAHVSGAHINPAVTVALWVTGKAKTVQVLPYILAQCVGAICAAFALKALFPGTLTEQVSLGATTPGEDISAVAALVIEAILTFFLVFVIFGAAVDERGPGVKSGAFAIGLAVTMDIIVGGAFTGGSMNPARSLGPALASGTWSQFWVYVVGPIVGGALAAIVYRSAFMSKE